MSRGFRRLAVLSTTAAILLVGCRGPSTPDEDRPLVVDRLVPTPLESASQADGAGQDPPILTVLSTDYPAAPAPENGEDLTWRVSLDGIEWLELGYQVDPGKGLPDLDLSILLETPDGGPQELFRRRLTSRDFAAAVERVRVPLAGHRGEGTLRFRSEIVAQQGAPETGSAAPSLTWVDPKLLGRSRNVPHRPNVLIICVDALRADRLQTFGGATSAMPLMDGRLSRNGLVFTRAYANGSWSLPSMATLLTGRLPGFHHAGLRTDMGAGDEQSNFKPRETKGGIELVIHGTRYRFQMLHPSIPTIQEILGRAGYTTGAVYNNGYIDHATRVMKGMDFAENYHKVDAAVGTDDALEWIGRNSDRPFFLFLHYMDVHQWANRAEEMNPGWQARPYQPELRSRYLEAYDDRVTYTDLQVNRLLGDLQAKGILEDTYVVFTADHGEAFWEHGDYVGHGDVSKDIVLHVPLAIFGPGVPHATIADRVGLEDVVPTLLDLLDLPTDTYGLTGRSLLPTADAGGEASDRPLISEYVLGVPDRMTVYLGDWKLVLELSSDTPHLFRIESGSTVLVDVADQHEDVVKRLMRIAERHRRASGAHFRSLRYGTTEIDAATLESLRALGYIN